MEIEETLKKYEGLVKSIAKKYNGKGLSFEDLVQHGTIGLWEAIGKFDESLGYELSTYATYYIKNEIENGIAELSDLSKYKAQQVRKMKQIENELTQELKRKPTDREIADKLEMPLEKLEELKSLSQQNISLDNTIDSESDTVVADFIADTSMTPEEQMIYNEEKRDSKLIKEAFFNTLYQYERVIYTLRYEKNINVTNVAKKFKVTRARIIEIEKDIKEKQRAFFKSKEYYNIVDGKTDNLLQKIIEEQKRNIDVSATGEKIAKYENYEKLQEINFKEILSGFEEDFELKLKFPTFGAYFRDLCKTKGITYTTFKRATGLSETQFKIYKTDKAKPSIASIVALGVYYKISFSVILDLMSLNGYCFKANDRTHLAYMYILQHLSGYPIEYCNKVLELLGVEEDRLLKRNKKGNKKKKK